jgi:hypothetical protein
MIGGYKMLWNFFGSGHGKGPHDGVGAMVKRFFPKKIQCSWGEVIKC